MSLAVLGKEVEFEVNDGGCWLWRGTVRKPYEVPIVWRGKQLFFLRQLVLKEQRGEAVKGFTKPRCHQPRCCNPAHIDIAQGGRSGHWDAHRPPTTSWFDTNDKDCWLWTGRKTPQGYGLAMVEGHSVLTHRRAYELTHGAIPPRWSVLHSCDTPACCFPVHLSAGTQQVNSEQMASRLRSGSTKLSAAQIEAIRAERTEKRTPLRQLAKRYGVSHKTISKIARGWGYGARRETRRVFEALPKPTTECWLWEGALNVHGYARFKERGKMIGAHRRAWTIANGQPVPQGLVVRHACDNRACIRPDHLVIGTHQQNSDDTNGRLRGTHKLDWEQVRQMRRLREEMGLSYKKLARMFDIHETSVLRICRNEIYVEPKQPRLSATEAVCLVQLDGKLPNIALMRLSSHFKRRGKDVSFRRWTKLGQIQPELGVQPMALFASAIFERSRPLADECRRQFPNSVIGGTGVDTKLTVEEYGVESLDQDYSIYPHFTASMGFTQRGCRLKCSFCVVPKKEGAVRAERGVWDIWRGDPWPKHIILLDNDFFGQEEWSKRIGEIREGGFRVSFNQGINARMLTDEAAEAIASVEYYDDQFSTRRIYTAWDNRKDEDRLFRGLNALVRYGVKPDHIMVYMLCGYWPGETHEDREYRRKTLRDFGARPYPMPYVRTPELVGFQRFVIGCYDKRVDWKTWEEANYDPRKVRLESAA